MQARLLLKESPRPVPTCARDHVALRAPCLSSNRSGHAPAAARAVLRGVHVAIVDDRAAVDFGAIGALFARARALEVAAAAAAAIVTHAVLDRRHASVSVREVDHVHAVLGAPLAAAKEAACLHRNMGRSCSRQACRAFLYKPLLHLLLPSSVQKLLVLDGDLVLLRPLSELWDEFRSFPSSAVVGLAVEQNNRYDPMVGRNGGVQLLHLQRMRASAVYGRMLDWHASGRSHCASGSMGDQTFYTLVGYQHPLLVHTLGCEWNRQLAWPMRSDQYHRCPGRCGIVHATYGLRWLVPLMVEANASCALWARLLRGDARGPRNETVPRSLRAIGPAHYAKCCK